MVMKKGSYLLALVLALLCICPAEANQVSDMTIMVYLCGSNLESNSGAATKDIAEMLHAGYDMERLNVLVMAGGSQYWFCGFPSDSGNIYLLNKGRPKSVWRGEAQSMGKPETLSFFINYAREHYPAKRYGLILWDHGGGPMGGICSDTQFSGDSLSMTELRTALDDASLSQQPLAFIGFDACLMASVETALTVAPFADYMIASQDAEPGDGWNYSFLKDIETLRNKEIGKRIVDSYIAQGGDSGTSRTLSCVELSRVEKLGNRISQYFGSLSDSLVMDGFSGFAQARSSAQSFGSSVTAEQNYDLVDIRSLAKQYAQMDPLSYTRLNWALNSAVTYSRSTKEDCCGLSIYYPYYNLAFFQKNLLSFIRADSVPVGFKQFISRFYLRQVGSNGASEWNDLSTQTAVYTRSGFQRFSSQLTQEQMESFRTAQFLILEQCAGSMDDGLWSVVYSSPELQPGESGRLTWKYYGQRLYVVDDETRNQLAGPISNLWLNSGSTYYTVVQPETTAFESTSIVGDVQCQYQLNSETGWLEFQQALVYDEILGAYSPRQAFSLTDYPALRFPNLLWHAKCQSDGSLPSPDTWEPVSDPSRAVEVELGSWHLEYQDEPAVQSKLYGCFLIRDIRNHTTTTALAPVTIWEENVTKGVSAP